MSDKTIIVTGSRGQLGSELQELSDTIPDFHFVFFDSTTFPIQDLKTAKAVFEKYRPAFFINAAAYTAVDKAEQEKSEAERVNGIAVGQLAALCQEYDTGFIHISTDYVFNGKSDVPLKEDDFTDPVNAYGASKLLGEQLAVQHNSNSIIIRTSWVYSSFGKNFVKTMMRLMHEKESISVISDQVGSPTYAADLAKVILHIISSGKWIPGIYHFSNEGVISWYDFAAEIKSLTGSACIIHPIPTSQYPTPAVRPGYSVMDKSRIINTYGIQLAGWKESLAACIAQLEKGQEG